MLASCEQFINSLQNIYKLLCAQSSLIICQGAANHLWVYSPTIARACGPVLLEPWQQNSALITAGVTYKGDNHNILNEFHTRLNLPSTTKPQDALNKLYTWKRASTYGLAGYSVWLFTAITTSPKIQKASQKLKACLYKYMRMCANHALSRHEEKHNIYGPPTYPHPSLTFWALAQNEGARLVSAEQRLNSCTGYLYNDTVPLGYLWQMIQFNESLFIKNDFKPKKAKFSLTFLQVFQLVNDVKCWAQHTVVQIPQYTIVHQRGLVHKLSKLPIFVNPLPYYQEQSSTSG
ncbi:hypothetical protein PROFUN_03702 [Planoprotostelium fungivorum]|uniref:Uncharacterized protein n=1 Tax=Planoprotostelium fungivorum TaxID=1890364 RepID=A0A2P6NDL2_9EUKA|nr:hypothetical protein PROFUN_03702 [Planoprotostelium fungivorum]